MVARHRPSLAKPVLEPARRRRRCRLGRYRRGGDVVWLRVTAEGRGQVLWEPLTDKVGLAPATRNLYKSLTGDTAVFGAFLETNGDPEDDVAAGRVAPTP